MSVLIALVLAVKYWWLIVGVIAVIVLVRQLGKGLLLPIFVLLVFVVGFVLAGVASGSGSRHLDVGVSVAGGVLAVVLVLLVMLALSRRKNRRVEPERRGAAAELVGPEAFRVRYRTPTVEERRRAEAERERAAAEREKAAAERDRLRDLEYAKSAMDLIDSMSGAEFENYVAARLRLAGYDVEMTAATGDYGVDLIATKGHDRLAIQCKRYGKPVGVAAVQQVFSGAIHHGCTGSMVVTNQDFTPRAKRMVEKLNCRLVGRAEMQRWTR